MRRLHVSGRAGDDSGVALLMALLFVMVVGIALAALLPYAQAGISEASTAAAVRSEQNAIDGGVQGAIGLARSSTDPCTTYTAPSYPNPVGSGTVSVSVSCVDASGFPSNPVDVPPYAILTTGSNLTVSGKVLVVSGGVYSSGNIDTTGGAGGASVDVIGDAYSVTHTCGRVTVPIGFANCPSTGVPALPSLTYPPALGTTTAAAQTTIDGLAKDPQGTCQSSTSIVTFVPGYYSEPPTKDMNASDASNCIGNTSNVWWFSPCTPYPGCVTGATSPGIYYFDFPDGSYGSHYTNAGSSTTGPGYVWNLDAGSGIDVIGGTLADSGWSSSTTESAVNAVSAGSRCDGTQEGVQFILGGASQITTGNNSEIELCASATSTSSLQQMSLYGLSKTYGLVSPSGPRTVTNDNQPAGSAADTPGDLHFKGVNTSNGSILGTDNPDGAKAQGDNDWSGAAFTGSGSQTYGVDLTNYTAPKQGSLIANAWIDVTHLETSSQLNPSLTITYADGSTDTCNVPNNTVSSVSIPPSWATDSVNLMTCKNKTLANASLRWKLLESGFKVTYEVQSNKAGTALVDGVQLKTQSVAPALEAERCISGSAAGCVQDAYSNSGSSATDNTFFFGTVFTPDSSMTAVVHNSPNTIFHRGVIVYSLAATANASSTQADPPFQLPHASSTRTLLFTATTGGRTRLQALVHFVDCVPVATCEANANAPGNLFWPGRSVKILEWTPFP